MFTMPFLCCKVWPISPIYPVGSCGHCGTHPVPLARRAQEVAIVAHEGQLDRGGLPYIDHPTRVAAMVEGDPYAEAVAWLHDVVEDTEIDLSSLLDMGFPDNVVEAVDAISKRPGEELEDYLARVRDNDLAYTVKLADVADNSSERRLAQLDDATQVRLRAKYVRTKALLAEPR